MSDGETVFQCDYCGRLRPLRLATFAWADAWQTKDGEQVVTVAVACSPSCAEKVNTLRVVR